MNNYIILLLVFSSKSLLGQSSLEVNIKDCREINQYEYLKEFKVFRNDSLIKTIDTEHQHSLIIKNLDYGKYNIEYKTNFDKIEKVTIELTERKKYTIDLCLNYFDHQSDPYTPFIDRLENKESYSIQMRSQGCFHSSNETLTIKRKSDKFYIDYQGKEKELDSNEVDLIKQFEKELNYMQSEGCTTMDYYTINYKENEVYILDGSCSWNGFYYLKKELKLIE